ncbi:hypothetical protein HGRIS_006433 [Hohenbuehelia grisea]|uniref:Uncharacterized protein n=1 Tax=Hohenbuehelia grisea TaxID=104357 RepID=A0ABR3K0T9_9AGAR
MKGLDPTGTALQTSNIIRHGAQHLYTCVASRSSSCGAPLLSAQWSMSDILCIFDDNGIKIRIYSCTSGYLQQIHPGPDVATELALDQGTDRVASCWRSTSIQFTWNESTVSAQGLAIHLYHPFPNESVLYAMQS